MINLFEYQNKVKWESSDKSFSQLDEFLDGIWKNREKSDYFRDDLNEEDDRVETQRFLQFLHHKENELKSNKYVGVIHFQDQTINLLPKIFYEKEQEYNEGKLNVIQNHILWWLSYCRKIKFPNYQTSMGSVKSNFFEVIIYLFAKYTRELLSNTIYQQYEEVDNELSFIKGRLNTNEYIKQNIAKGRWHKLNCTYDSFEFDNKFNQIIKFVSTLLYNSTKNQENKKFLREILFILDEVSDVKVTASDCLKLKFNPAFKDFETVNDYCYLFLNNYVSFNFKNNLKLFAFLLPMEYVFEDFIFGFIEKEMSDNVKALAKENKKLDIGSNFNLIPDLILNYKSNHISKQIILDTKYKMIYSENGDLVKKVSQSDIYQMIAYAIRFEVDKILLIYPSTIINYQSTIVNENKLIIEDEFAFDNLAFSYSANTTSIDLSKSTKKEIKINIHQIPIINLAMFNDSKDNDNKSIQEMFDGTKNNLIGKLNDILEQVFN